MKSIRLSEFFSLFLSMLLFAPVLLAAEGEGAAKKKTVLDIIHDGGLVMYILIIASVMIMAFTIEAIIKIRQARLAPPAVLAQLKDAIVSGNYPTAYQVCVSNPCYLSKIVQAGLERLGRGREAAEKVMGEVTAKELNGIKSNIQYLSVIGVVSPMVGLTGTVMGMIKAFETLGSSGAADPSKLAGNISEVLVATGTGLFVAIPAFVLYYVFRNRIQVVSVAVDSEINLLFEDIPFEQLTGYRLADYLGNASAPAAA